LTPINYLGYSIPKEDFSSLPSVQREFSVRAIKIPLYILYGQRRDAQAVA
jgi:hypothetical protein